MAIEFTAPVCPYRTFVCTPASRFHTRIVLPAAEIAVPLPTGSKVTSVEVVPSSPQPLGALDIPTYTPGVKLYPDNIPDRWEAIPPSAGTVPLMGSSNSHGTSPPICSQMTLLCTIKSTSPAQL